MSANVLTMRPKQALAHEDWLTVRRMTAYYVLGAVNPALLASGADFATVRETAIDQIEAALHAAEQYGDVDAKGRDYVIAVMRQDAEAKAARLKAGGW